MNVAWLAGFFDGEGCITSSLQYVNGKYITNPRISIQLTITQKDASILASIREVYGGSISVKGNGVSHLRITGKYPMKKILDDMLPYSICKRPQIELALLFIETIRDENLGCTAMSANVHEQRLEIHMKLKAHKDGHNVG